MRFKSRDELQNRSLIVEIKSAKVEDGVTKGYFCDARLDESRINVDKIKTGEKTAQTNPHLSSTKREGVNPQTNEKYEYVSHDTYYQASQVDKMIEAAGNKNVTTKDGKHIIGITANLTPVASKNQTLIVKTNEPMGPTKNPYFGKNALERSNNVKAAAKEYAAAHKDAAKAVEAEMEAQAPEAEAGAELG